MANLFSIQGRLYSPANKHYGIFFMVVNNQTEYVDSAAIIISKYSEIYETNIDVSFKKLDALIAHTKYKGQFVQALTMDLQDNLNAVADNSLVFKNILAEVKLKQTAGLKKSFLSLINRILRDEQLEIELVLREVTPDDLAIDVSVEDKMNLSDKAGNDADFLNINTLPEGTYLNAGLIVDPISGKVITDVKVGDKVFLKLDAQNTRTSYFIDQKKLRNGEKILPCPSTVVKKFDENGFLNLLFQIDEQIYAKISEKEKVMLKMATQQDVNTFLQKSSPQRSSATTTTPVTKKANSSKPNLLIYAGIGVAFIFLLIIGYFMML